MSIDQDTTTSEAASDVTRADFDAAAHCVHCQRPFPTADEFERHRPIDGDCPTGCWCEHYCWVEIGGDCIGVGLMDELEVFRRMRTAEARLARLDDLDRFLVDQLDDPEFAAAYLAAQQRAGSGR